MRARRDSCLRSELTMTSETEPKTNAAAAGTVEPQPPHGISMERHAEVSAFIAEGDAPLAKVLERFGIPEDHWNASTAYWMHAMADDAMKNGVQCRVPMLYSDAFAKAQDSIKPAPAMTPEEWATLTVEIQQVGNPAQPLARRNLSTADYIRSARHWAKTLSSDPAQNKRFFATYESLQPRPEDEVG